jgi:hypothetical protein
VQQPLLDLLNPLDLKIGKDFFSEIPKVPGVYKMFGDNGELLYVGKAKNLRIRLMSYRRIKITTSSRKSLRLVHQVSDIQWEVCKNEEAALIRENELLRELKPPFNVVNTAPETYFYFTVKIVEEEISSTDQLPIVITLTMKPADPEAAVFGAFKGLASCHRAFFAMRRMLWLMHERKEEDELYFPLHLIRRQKLYPYACSVDKVWLNRLAGFFHGFSNSSSTQTEPEFISALRTATQDVKNSDPFHKNWILEDIEALLKFYRSGPARNIQMKPLCGIDSPLIAQNKIDDLIVKNQFLKR